MDVTYDWLISSTMALVQVCRHIYPTIAVLLLLLLRLHVVAKARGTAAAAPVTCTVAVVVLLVAENHHRLTLCARR